MTKTVATVILVSPYVSTLITILAATISYALPSHLCGQAYAQVTHCRCVWYLGLKPLYILVHSLFVHSSFSTSANVVFEQGEQGTPAGETTHAKITRQLGTVQVPLVEKMPSKSSASASQVNNKGVDPTTVVIAKH